MSYFTIMAELRGCYADNDSAFTIRCNTRRELKAALEWEARYCIAGSMGMAQSCQPLALSRSARFPLSARQ